MGHPLRGRLMSDRFIRQIVVPRDRIWGTGGKVFCYLGLGLGFSYVGKYQCTTSDERHEHEARGSNKEATLTLHIGWKWI
jgi:hypothetical protein